MGKTGGERRSFPREKPLLYQEEADSSGDKRGGGKEGAFELGGGGVWRTVQGSGGSSSKALGGGGGEWRQGEGICPA